ncbi:MAG: EpsG family protein [Clostridia bacterium]|nr:EpsG family protein [Clostridia bacterium]
MNRTNIDKKEVIKCFVIVLVFLLINIVFRNTIGADYSDYLVRWIDDIVELGKVHSLEYEIGNYTPPYMYFLILGTYITTDYIFWIKLISNLFTIGIAILVYFIIKEFKKDIKFSSALMILLVPSVLINSSIIGQCDSIYTFFVLLFIFLLLKDKKRSALFCYGVAIAFKMQAIFIAPVFLYLIVKRKIKIVHLLYIPLGFFVSMIPAMIFGKSVLEILNILIAQTSAYSKFVKSAPNIYSVLHLNYKEIARWLKILLSVCTVLLSIFIVFKNTKGKEYSQKTFLEKIMLLSIIVPYFLPSMHDRYFYMANIFIYIYFLFIDDTKSKQNQIIHFSLVSVSCALPVVLFNFVSSIGEMAAFLAEWIGVSLISSTIMSYMVLLCFDRYLTKEKVTKK